MATTDVLKKDIPKHPPMIVKGCESKKLISNSSRNAFTFCPRYFELSYVIGLRHKQDPLPLGFGSLLHRAFEMYHLGKSALDIAFVIDEWREAELATLEELTDPRYGADKIEESAELVIDMLTRYEAKYGGADRERYDILGVEVPFIVPIMQPYVVNGETCWRKDSDYAYTGKIDLLVLDKRTNQVMVWDHKSTALTDLQTFERDVVNAGPGQRIGYVYGAGHFHENVAGMVFDVARKKTPAKTGTKQCPTCKGEGSVDGVKCEPGAPFATYKSGQKKGEAKPTCHGSGIGGISATPPDTTVELFIADVAKLQEANPDLDMTSFQPILDVLKNRPDRFLYRFYAPVTPADVTAWMRDVYLIAHDMGRAAKGGGAWRNLAACSVNGRDCSYRVPCWSGWEGNGNYEIVKTDPFAPHEAAADDEEEGGEAQAAL